MEEARSAITGLDQRIGGLQGELEGIASGETVQNSKIAALEAMVAGQTSEIETLKSTASDQKRAYEALQNEIAAHQGTLTITSAPPRPGFSGYTAIIRGEYLFPNFMSGFNWSIIRDGRGQSSGLVDIGRGGTSGADLDVPCGSSVVASSTGHFGKYLLATMDSPC